MEKKIKEYEKFINAETKKDLSPAERGRLMELHRDMVANFQHERLIHLIITLFFAVMAVVFLFITAWGIAAYGPLLGMVPLYLLTVILVVLTGFYVKHYYFLENHVQGLYKFMIK
ncbi:hypothetical protein IJG04_03235 [Candidatus Saccharibacteria bacterium]|nr:hypothetical protein [Candidatus Saccharibacteria bacterium]